MSEKNKDTDTTVTEITIPKDKLDAIYKILECKTMWSNKKTMLLAVMKFNPSCCICGQITPSLYQVNYDKSGAVKLEIYCSNHIESYTKNKDKTSEEIAESYGLQIGEIEHTPPSH